MPLRSFTRSRDSAPLLLQFAANKRPEKRFNDVIIQCGASRILANKMVLSCYSPYFDQILPSSNEDQVTSSEINISGVDEESLKLLIDYLYSGELSLDCSNVLSLLQAADKLQLEEVKNFCFEVLPDCLTVENCISLLRNAVKNKNFQCRDKIYDYISINYEAVTETSDFNTLEITEFFLLVFHHAQQRVYVNDEVLCRTLLRWTKHDEEERKDQLDRLSKFVNVNKLSLNTINSLINEPLIKGEKKLLSRLQKRREHMINSAKIVSVGGQNTGRRVFVVYSSDDEESEIFPGLPLPLYVQGSLLVDNIVYCIGGRIDEGTWTDRVWKMNLSQVHLQWKEICPLLESKSGRSSAAFHGELVICGGRKYAKRLDSVEVYDFMTNVWRSINKLQQARSGNESVECCGSLYTMGGSDGKIRLKSVERLDGFDHHWRYVSPMNEERFGFAVVEYKGSIYAIGGINNDSAILNTVEKYDSSTDKWTYVSEMNSKRWDHAACVMHDRIYVIGGINGKDVPVKEIDCYNPTSDRWEIVGNHDDPLLAHFLLVVPTFRQLI